MKHVLFVHDNRSIGGVGAVSRQMAEGLESRGWSVDHLHLAGRAGWLRALARVTRRRGVLVATQNFSTSYVAGALAALSRRPWVMCVHGPITDVLQAAPPGALKLRLLHRVYRNAPFVVCSSQSSLDSLGRFAPTRRAGQEVTVIRNTAAPAFFRTPAPAGRAPSRAVGFVGRLSAEKQPHLLLQALRALPHGYRLDIVGTGPLAASLESEGRAEIAAGRLRLLGLRDVGPATYRDWDATLLCSAYEGYPLVLLESLASGVPVASTPIPPAVEMLGLHAPYMVARASTAQALADAVLQLARREPSEVQRDIAAVNRDHDPAMFIARWDALLSKAIER